MKSKTFAVAAGADAGDPKPETPRKRARKSPAAGDPGALHDSTAADLAAEEGLTPRRRTRAKKPAAEGEGASPGAEAAKSPRKAKAATAAVAAAAEAEGGVAVVATAAVVSEAITGPSSNAAPKRASKPKAPKAPAGPLYDASMRPPACSDPALSVVSWNVAGLRSLLKKDKTAIQRLVERERVDVLCLQETKLQHSHVEGVTKEIGLDGWFAAFNCSTAKKGYSGVATLCRVPPLSSSTGIGVEEHDDEGRVVTVELPDVFLFNAYVPNSGDGLKRLDYRISKWDVAFSDYVRGLEAKKPVVLTGDLNCAHHPIDIHNPQGNLKSAGFTQEERDSFGSRLVAPGGFLVDTFRNRHPGVVGYTYYSYRFNARAKGIGWRLDYFLVSQALSDRVHDSFILKDVEGSDHVPLGVVIKKA